MKKIEKYCFPISLSSINIKQNEQPFAHGAFCNIFQVGNYAIKCPRVPAATGSDIERAIIHEIFLSRPLSHIPNILIVYGGIRLSNYGVCIVMEYVNGPSLSTALDDGTILNLTFEERLDIALGICKGLGELHLARIIHRDFKPANVLLQKTSSGCGYIPKIADFGVSFLIQTASATAVKNSGGTVGYDAPEVADGGTPSIQSDIYALAFTLYELLTVQRPFAGYKESQIITKFTVRGERPTNWTISTADRTSIIVPTFLKHTIEKGWSIAPENRARIGEIICAIRKSINFDYQSCPKQMSSWYSYCLENDSSYDFLDKFDSFELLAIQEIIKRLVIDDCEAIELLLNNQNWG
jgi:serine/threonine protein kinase